MTTNKLLSLHFLFFAVAFPAFPAVLAAHNNKEHQLLVDSTTTPGLKGTANSAPSSSSSSWQERRSLFENKPTATYPNGKTTKRVIVSIQVNNDEEIQYIANEYDVLDINKLDGYVTVLVGMQEKNELEEQLGKITVTTDESATAEIESLSTSGISGYPCYRTVEETYRTGAAIAAKNKNIASWEKIGESWGKELISHGYDIFVLKITNKDTPGPKPIFFANFAIHAREYATAELGTRFAEMLVQGYGTNADITTLIDHQEFHLVLQTNPDGRKVAENGDLRRKNTNPGSRHCDEGRAGVDLNRNFPFQWGGRGSSNKPCSEGYRGETSASEPEVYSLIRYLDGIFPIEQRQSDPVNIPAPDDVIGVALDIHSYGGQILFPWGFTDKDCPNHRQFVTIANKLAYFNQYTPRKLSDFYAAAGIADDFYYAKYGVAGLTYEVGTKFFESCDSFESKILPDNLESLLHAAKIARNPFKTLGPDIVRIIVADQGIAVGDIIEVSATVDATRYKSPDEASTHTIASASIFIDVPPWSDGATSITMAAKDGAFDSVVEDVEVSLDTTNFSPGRHMIYFVGTSKNGNVGAVSSAFLDLACTSDSQCDDGLYCNGNESCSSGTCVPGADPSCAADEVCDEISTSCITASPQEISTDFIDW